MVLPLVDGGEGERESGGGIGVNGADLVVVEVMRGKRECLVSVVNNHWLWWGGERGKSHARVRYIIIAFLPDQEITNASWFFCHLIFLSISYLSHLF